MEFWSLLQDIGVLLLASIVMGALCIRLGQSPIVGYLLAGMFLGGPGSLGLVHAPHEIELISELGVSLLLFSLGLEFSPARLKEFGMSSLMSAVLQVTLTPLVGLVFCMLFGLSLLEGFAAGIVITLSSTACVLRLLNERSELDSPHGRNAIAILLAQDIAVVPLALIMTLLGSKGGMGDLATSVGQIVLGVLALALGLYVLLTKVAVAALKSFTLEQNRELTVLLTFTVGIGSAWASQSIGVSPALGAFMAGMFMGISPFSVQVRADIATFRIVFLTLFFGAAGIVADPIWILNHMGPTLGVCLLIMVGKTAFSSLLFFANGQGLAVAVSSAMFVSQVGEFAFVLSGIGFESKVISPYMHQLLISATILSMLITPYFAKFALRMGLWVQDLIGVKAPPPQRTPTEARSPVFVLGMGVAGRSVAESLKDTGEDVIAIDLNFAGGPHARQLGIEFHVGDVRQGEVLDHYGIRHAKLVVITIPFHAAVVSAIFNVKQLAPSAKIVCRSRYQLHAQALRTIGADFVYDDESSVAEQLAKASILRV